MGRQKQHISAVLYTMLYDDDTRVLMSGKDLKKRFSIKANKLSLIVKKTFISGY